MMASKHSKRVSYFPFITFGGKHSCNRLILYSPRNYGKHAKNEMIVYNPIYAKISSVIGSLAVATSFLAFVTLGKYKGTLASSDSARVAKYVLELSEPNTTITEFVPNSTRSIDFDIKNYQGEIGAITAQCEVDVRYKIKIQETVALQLPITYKLYRVYSENNKQEITLTNGETGFISVDTSSVLHRYRLEFTWPSNMNNRAYEYLTDNLTITVESEQVD